jgi:hypothetical protein
MVSLILSEVRGRFNPFSKHLEVEDEGVTDG